MRTLYLCGSGNPEAVRLSLLINRKQQRWDRILLLDDDPAKVGRQLLGVVVAGPFNLLLQADQATDEVANLVARTTAKRWVVRHNLEKYGLRFATLIHPDVEVEGVEFGSDVTVYGRATLGAQSVLGEGSVVLMGGVVGHGSRVGRCCVVAPNAVINARVQVGDGVYVGSNATILPDLKLEPWVTVGANSVVMRDVPAGATIVGVPGRVICVDVPKLANLAANCSVLPAPEDRKAPAATLGSQ